MAAEHAAAPERRSAGHRVLTPTGAAVLATVIAATAAVADPVYRTVDAAGLQALLDRGVPVVDLRTPQEWRQTGIIDGAERITAFDLRGRFVESFPDRFIAVAGPEDEVALICWTGARSRAIAEAISTRIGYTKVYNVDGGMEAWIDQGLPVEACTGC